jgi:hypothetical protein
MTPSAPLQGTDLIDCARANATKGIEITAQRCGYGEDLATFERELKQAGDYIGIEIHSFNDLITDQQKQEQEPGIEVAPDSPTQL